MCGLAAVPLMEGGKTRNASIFKGQFNLQYTHQLSSKLTAADISAEDAYDA